VDEAGVVKQRTEQMQRDKLKEEEDSGVERMPLWFL
jgi:hypothetical protein